MWGVHDNRPSSVDRGKFCWRYDWPPIMLTVVMVFAVGASLAVGYCMRY